jgi:hypothetical protein
MTQFHQFATYFALMLGSLSVVGVCLYGAVRCIRVRMYLAGWNFLFLIACWFLANTMLLTVLYAIATPNSATPTHPAEYAAAPVYLAIAALVSYAVLRYVKRNIPSKDEWSLSTEHVNSNSDDDESLLLTQGESHSILVKMTDHKKKIAGVVVIAIAAASMRYGLILESGLFVVVGVSLIMDVRIWRS